MVVSLHPQLVKIIYGFKQIHLYFLLLHIDVNDSTFTVGTARQRPLSVPRLAVHGKGGTL